MKRALFWLAIGAATAAASSFSGAEEGQLTSTSPLTFIGRLTLEPHRDHD